MYVPSDLRGPLVVLLVLLNQCNAHFTGVSSVSAYNFHSCVVTVDDRMKCWGSNTEGWLSYGDSLERGKSVAQMGNNLPYVDLGSGERVAVFWVPLQWLPPSCRGVVADRLDGTNRSAM
eukprot:6293973-Amphidinium_carterae.1